MTTAATKPLSCAMPACCAMVTHIDDKGFVYCAPHGTNRRAVCRCRKLRPHEAAMLRRGELIRYDRPAPKRTETCGRCGEEFPAGGECRGFGYHP
jgi:hypothetical protein